MGRLIIVVAVVGIIIYLYLKNRGAQAQHGDDGNHDEENEQTGGDTG